MNADIRDAWREMARRPWRALGEFILFLAFMLMLGAVAVFYDAVFLYP